MQAVSGAVKDDVTETEGIKTGFLTVSKHPAVLFAISVMVKFPGVA